MATTDRGSTPRLTGVAKKLFTDPYQFDFFQAVRLMERVFPDRKAVGKRTAPTEEILRFRAHPSVAFPPSAITDLLPADFDFPIPRMTVSFLGLTGPSGALPLHYTQLILDLHRDVRGPERRALRDWFDLFNHRFISLFFRAWEKYRFYIPYERGEAFQKEPDPYTLGLFSLIGLGTPSLRQRMRVAVPGWDEEGLPTEKPLTRIDDLGLLFYSGFFAQRIRNAANLSLLLNDYFQLPIEVQQFQGQWLQLEPPAQTCLGRMGTLGVDAVAGSRVWDVQGKIRLRVGPLAYKEFEAFLPDRTPISERKTLFSISHLTRFYIGNEIDFDVQLIVRKEAIPECQMVESGFGARLGWNTWLISKTPTRDAEDAVFESECLIHIAESKLIGP
jgi:type VI secretion system protein ImpH